MLHPRRVHVANLGFGLTLGCALAALMAECGLERGGLEDGPDASVSDSAVTGVDGVVASDGGSTAIDSSTDASADVSLDAPGDAPWLPPQDGGPCSATTQSCGTAGHCV